MSRCELCCRVPVNPIKKIGVLYGKEFVIIRCSICWHFGSMYDYIIENSVPGHIESLEILSQ
jgi:hypothetical protein